MAVEFERLRPASEAGWFWGIARRQPDRLALTDTDGTTFTFGELADFVNRNSHALRAERVRPGDSITVATRNCAAYIALELAVGQCGIYLVPTAAHQTQREFTHVIGDSGSRLVVVDDVSVESAGAAAACGLDRDRVVAVRPLRGAGADLRTLDTLVADMPTEAPPEREAGRYMYYTAGTTGSPKGAVVPRSALSPEEDADTWVPPFAEAFSFEPFHGVHLVTGPLYHRGPGIWAIVALHLRHTVVVMRRFDPEEMLRLIDEYGVTSSHIVPTVFHRMLQLPDDVRRSYDTSSLQQVLHAAAPCPVHVKRAMVDWLGPVLWEYYGSTEGGGTMVRPDEWEKHPGTVGRPWPNAAVRVTDDERNPVPPHTPGTIWISNGTRFTYRGAPEKTAAAWDGDWFTVGDIGHLDEDGWLYVGDRRSDLVISGGVNVYPAEVEGSLLAHPAVADVAVLGLPDEEWGQQVTAVVELRPGHAPDDATRADLEAHCRAELAGPKVPRRIMFVETLPRNEIGKVGRNRLADAIRAGRVVELAQAGEGA